MDNKTNTFVNLGIGLSGTSAINIESSAKLKSEYFKVLKTVIDEDSNIEHDKLLDKISSQGYKYEKISKKISELSKNEIKSFSLSSLFTENKPINVENVVNIERKENAEFFASFKKYIDERYEGKFIVIANKDIKGFGDSWDEVKDKALEANHRFIIKIGED